MSGWQDIASAPRDGSYFLTTNCNSEDGEYEINRYDPYFFQKYTETEPGSNLFRREKTPITSWLGSNIHRATHWCAIPDAPTTPSTEGQGE